MTGIGLIGAAQAGPRRLAAETILVHGSDDQKQRYLEPYAQGLDLLANLDLLVGYAPDGSRRFSSTGGDSPLGNMIAKRAAERLMQGRAAHPPTMRRHCSVRPKVCARPAGCGDASTARLRSWCPQTTTHKIDTRRCQQNSR